MIMKQILSSVLVATLTGCSFHNGLERVKDVPEFSANHRLLPYDSLQYMSCDYISGFPNPKYPALVPVPDPNASSVFTLPESHLTGASQAFAYALMSSNAYRDSITSPLFRIPGWEMTGRYESNSGLALEEWVRKSPSEGITEVAIAFKGTDVKSSHDWRANLAIGVEPRQYREAFEHVQSLLARPEYQGARVVTTGHSLGGGIALNVALRSDRDIDIFVFNPSPRAFHRVGTFDVPDGILIYESGEALAFFRWLWEPRLHPFYRLRYNYLDFLGGLSLLPEHGMYLLSRGLLLTAVKAGNTEATAAFTSNFRHLDLREAFAASGRPEQDAQHCMDIFGMAENANR
jgi:hypothetical protein